MSNEILRDILKLKMRMADRIVDHLPGAAGEEFRRVQRVLLETVRDVANEYLEKKEEQKAEDKSVTPVVIE